MNFVAIDFETANSNRSSACEIGLTVVENGIIKEAFSYLIKPEPNYFHSINTSIHGINARMVANEPSFDLVWEQLQPLFENNNLIAHNAGFDFSVLRYSLDHFGITYPNLRYSCSYQISKRVWRHLPSYRLNSLCEHLDVPLNHHRAESDAIACAKIALKAFEQHEVSTFEELEEAFNLKIGKLYPGGYKPASSKRSYYKRKR